MPIHLEEDGMTERMPLKSFPALKQLPREMFPWVQLPGTQNTIQLWQKGPDFISGWQQNWFCSQESERGPWKLCAKVAENHKGQAMGSWLWFLARSPESAPQVLKVKPKAVMELMGSWRCWGTGHCLRNRVAVERSQPEREAVSWT